MLQKKCQLLISFIIFFFTDVICHFYLRKTHYVGGFHTVWKIQEFFRFSDFPWNQIRQVFFTNVLILIQLISRKIWVAEKLWSFHTMCHIRFSKYENRNVVDCGNFRTFLSFRFYVKSILEKLEDVKLPFLPFWELWFLLF